MSPGQRSFCIASVVLILSTFSAFCADVPAAPIASPESGKVYADRGTLELGMNGNGGVINSSTSGTTPTGFPATTYSLTGTLFAKYFLIKGLHLGGAFLGMGNLQYDSTDALVGGSGNMTLLGEVGYTLQITPALQIDVTGGGGVTTVFYTFTPLWSPTFLGQAMLLFPVGENAVIGVGGMLLGMNVDGVLNDMGYHNYHVSLFTLNTSVVAQISIYF